jgi:hypothetical protein
VLGPFGQQFAAPDGTSLFRRALITSPTAMEGIDRIDASSLLFIMVNAVAFQRTHSHQGHRPLAAGFRDTRAVALLLAGTREQYCSKVHGENSQTCMRYPCIDLEVSPGAIHFSQDP